MLLPVYRNLLQSQLRNAMHQNPNLLKMFIFLPPRFRVVTRGKNITFDLLHPPQATTLFDEYGLSIHHEEIYFESWF